MQTATQERIIRPAKNVLGSLRLPGDKSISHRYGMLAAFAEGTSRFANFSTGADCASTLACMQALGARVQKLDDGRIEITGVGGRVTPSDHPLDCGNSGSTMRMISGLARSAARTVHTDRRRILVATADGTHPQDLSKLWVRTSH